MEKVRKRTRKQQIIVDRLLNDAYDKISSSDLTRALKYMSAYEKADWALSCSKSNWKERWI